MAGVQVAAVDSVNSGHWSPVSFYMRWSAYVRNVRSSGLLTQHALVHKAVRNQNPISRAVCNSLVPTKCLPQVICTAFLGESPKPKLPKCCDSNFCHDGIYKRDTASCTYVGWKVCFERAHSTALNLPLARIRGSAATGSDQACHAAAVNAHSLRDL